MKGSKFRSGLAASWGGLVILILLWQLVSSVGLKDASIFPGPVAVIKQTATYMELNQLLRHMGISLIRIGLGFAIGGIAGVILGITCGWYLRLGSILRTPIEILRPIPPLAWIPIAIIWLGLGEASKVFIISLGAFFPLFTNTYKGMVNIDPDLIRAGQTLHLQGRKLLMRVVVPATLPDIATGIRIGWSYSFGCMVAAELIAANSGLGYMIMHSRELGLVGMIIAGIVLIGAVNLLTDYLIQGVILKRWLRWHFQSTA
jgi:ABC-type nitrate/sulfonate/bicarbonate transport system permease component